ncbi:helix-turn-helix transcriptional regulator [Devosia sp. Leaf420]|uniref:helix-turn-helix transcriptional regulator n=1 Tax=Devosia sp. Leaf420 TaxID=1736374 RepID=UPI000AA972D5|nr:hypothetical protein [Devosia sp. Leaf420]
MSKLPMADVTVAFLTIFTIVPKRYHHGTFWSCPGIEEMSALDITLDYQDACDERAPAHFRQLTRDEFSIAEALAGGRSLPEIALLRDVSIDELTADIDRIFGKLGVATLAHMLLLFAEMPAMPPRADVVYVEDLGMAYGFGAPSRRLE